MASTALLSSTLLCFTGTTAGAALPVSWFYPKPALFTEDTFGQDNTTLLLHHAFLHISFFFFVFEAESHYVAQAGREPTILLPQTPKGWDFRSVPPLLAISYIYIYMCVYIYIYFFFFSFY
jgi:hypothetical protein